MNFELRSLNEEARIEFGKSVTGPIRVAYTNRFYGSCVFTARIRRSVAGEPVLDRNSIAISDLEVRRGTPRSLAAAAEAFLLRQMQRGPQHFHPENPAGPAAGDSIWEPALRQLRRFNL